MARVRNRAITIRLTEKEYELVSKKIKESGLTQQSFIINAVMDVVLYGKEGLKYLIEIRDMVGEFVKQVRGIAANINQMTKIANANKATITENELQIVKRDYDYITKEGGKIWQSLRLLTVHQKAVPECESA